MNEMNPARAQFLVRSPKVLVMTLTQSEITVYQHCLLARADYLVRIYYLSLKLEMMTARLDVDRLEEEEEEERRKEGLSQEGRDKELGVRSKLAASRDMMIGCTVRLTVKYRILHTVLGMRESDGRIDKRNSQRVFDSCKVCS